MSPAKLADAQDVRLGVEDAKPKGAEGKGPEDFLSEGHEDVRGEDFTYSEGITSLEAEQLLQQWGRNELEEKSQSKLIIFLKGLIQPMPIMIWIAIIIEAAITNWIDMGILLGIQFANAFIGWYEHTKAADAVAALKKSLKPQATVKRDGKWQVINAGLVVPGDMVLLAAGSAVPADCVVNHGDIEVDQSALTGESLPVNMKRGSSCKMGSTVVKGEVEGTVEFTGKHTFFGKTAAMINSASDGMGHLQKILMRIMIVLVGLSLLLCGACLIYLLASKVPVREAISFTVVLLVASIPIAIEIVCMTTLALGSRLLSAQGAIVTRLTSIEEMAGMNMLCSDKTGTLTLNKMVIQEDCPTYIPGENLQSVLKWAALAAKWKEPPRDALDTLVLTSAKLDELDVYTQLEYAPFDPVTKRTEATIKGPDGSTFKVTKGAPHVIAKLLQDPSIHRSVDAKVLELGMRGIRSLAVAKTDDKGAWRMVGILTFLDPPRPDTKDTLMKAMAFGVDVKMITGDQVVIAKETSRQLGLGTNIKNAQGLPSLGKDGKVPADLGKKYGALILEADGFGQVYPEHKYLIVEALRQEGFAVGMTGDGVNDAPALKRADIGIAVQGATDAARAAADLVLTQPGLSVVVDAIVISRQIFQRMTNFLNYRIAATLQLLVFFFIAVFAMEPVKYQEKYADSERMVNEYHLVKDTATGVESLEVVHWPEFFGLPVIYLMLITLLNDGTLISVGYDRVTASERPEKWNLRVLFTISIVLGAIACLSSLLLLHFALESANPDGLFARWNLPPISYGKIICMIYLKVSISDFLTLFSSRTGFKPFFSSRPSLILLGAGMTALGISSILGSLWPKGEVDHVPVQGVALDSVIERLDPNDPTKVIKETQGSAARLWPLWIWIYCVIWWFIQDACKVGAYWVLYHFDIFQARTSAMVNVREVAKFDDPDKPLARVSAGMVEHKLLGMQVDKAVEGVRRVSGGKGSAAVEASLALARTSVGVSRQSLTQQSVVRKPGAAAADLESGAANVAETVSQVEAALSGTDDAGVKSAVSGMKETAAKIGQVSEAMATQAASRKK